MSARLSAVSDSTGNSRRIHLNWNAITALTSAVSMIAFVATAVLIFFELRDASKSRYLQVTSELYSTWQSPDFMEAQLWLIHRLQETTWADFVAQHRADAGERAFHRVGAFYDRVGALVRLGIVDEKEILSTIGPYAIAVWAKLHPLVEEARRVENSTLFADFERILPACYECYVPGLIGDAISSVPAPVREPARITAKEVRRKMEQGERVILLDVRRGADAGEVEDTIEGALLIPVDSLPERFRELPKDREIVTFCA